MANFDEQLRSKIESFDAGVSPTPAEIDRLNGSLDAMAKSRYGLKHLLWLLLLLSFLGSQLWLLYSNRMLRKDLLSTQKSILDLRTEQQEERTSFTTVLHELAAKDRGGKQLATAPSFDSLQFINRYTQRNKKAEQHSLEAAILQHLKDLQKNGTLLPNSKAEAAILAQNTSSTGSSALSHTENDNGLKEGKGFDLLNTTGAETVVISEITVLDSSLFDSLYTEVTKLKNNLENTESEIPVLKAPLPFAWTASLGFKPGYSNLYLIDGRIVLDAHVVTGIEIDNTWALNTGFKFRTINVHEDIALNNSPLNQVSELPAEVIANGKELEGIAYGFYLPLELKYTANLGSFSPYLRLGTDINILTRDDLKIEYGNESYYYFDRKSRKLRAANASIGIGSSATLSNKLYLEYEGGYLVGNPSSTLVFNDKSGLYLQFRLGYNLLLRE